MTRKPVQGEKPEFVLACWNCGAEKIVPLPSGKSRCEVCGAEAEPEEFGAVRETVQIVRRRRA